ncbi:hypothetical protein D9757_007927 [Collybiopsis confluens]|uniref:Dopey N-terminal domain-containing protein n=1 Tax=Collybiopsis confluens TaxID=2823264 RepID=A0A8H5HBL4_9AGAR|nr:hypothetical protein D9757_007927 [Collybiopsis confluens]
MANPHGAVAQTAAAAQTFGQDPKYKKYSQQVEKCLNSFDNVHEWADCIAFLKQLLKTFQSYMQFKEIPRKLIVSKRLSQCLNPALPTGVHQRALDVYSHILAVLGPEGLKRDLPIWSSGLFPFFEYAATSVKPTLLNLYDTHYLPLQAGLRPVMKSFILALLPGLEEETGEFFEKVLSLLDRVSGTVSPSFFFQNIWLIMLTTPSARGTALNLLARRLPPLHGLDDITTIVGSDIGLMIRAFAAALEDENLLVRRSALDLLLTSLCLDSSAVQKRASGEDRTILMRAAVSVVLRRDLSLNRRLYSWLLGPTLTEKSGEKQIAYLKEHALELLTSTLKEDMCSPLGEYPESRPFKIFISLLDKWEIGAALSEVLVYDAFSAVKALVDTKRKGRGEEQEGQEEEDILMTANTLYEAVEPLTIWRQLLGAVLRDADTGEHETRFEAMEMVLFILKTFSQDEEIQTIHLPIIFAALVDMLDIRLKQDPEKILSPSTKAILSLLLLLLQQIPHVALLSRPELTGPPMERRPRLFPRRRRKKQKQPTVMPAASSGKTPVVPFNASLESLIRLSMIFGERLAGVGLKGNVLRVKKAYGDVDQGLVRPREMFALSLALIERLVTRLGETRGEEGQDDDVEVRWDPEEWLEVVLGTLHESATFTVIDRVISLVLLLSHHPDHHYHRQGKGRTTHLSPTFSIDDRLTMMKMVDCLLRYLRPQYAAYHVRAVGLIWELDSITTGEGGRRGRRPSHVESILAHAMLNSNSFSGSAEMEEKSEVYEAFGVLWRLSEDNLLPGTKFKIPMMIVLDALKSDDPGPRRISETWMRCSLKSYLRVLDPIMFDLMDPLIRRSQTTMKVKGKEIPGFLYERPFDQRYLNHLLEMLASVIRIGGQGFVKTTRISGIKRSPHAELVGRVEAAGFPDPDVSYLEVLVEILLLILQSEPKASLAPTVHPQNIVLQSTAIDLLQAIIARGEVNGLSLDIVEAAVIGKLYFSIHTGRLNLQNKLLHLLHSVISASIAADDSFTSSSSGNGAPARRVVTVGKQRPNSMLYDDLNANAGDRDRGDREKDDGRTVLARGYSVNPLLTQTLVDGIATSSNQAVLQHWLDFVLMAVPQFQPALQGVVAPLNECVGRKLLVSLVELLGASTRIRGGKKPSFSRRRRVSEGDLEDEFEFGEDTKSSTSDAEMIMLLNGLERLVLLSLAYNSAEVGGGGSGSGAGGTGDDASINEKGARSNEDQLLVRSPAYHALNEGIRVLYLIWGTLAWEEPEDTSFRDESLAMIYTRTRTRCRRVLEHIFRVQSAEVFESIVDCWNRDMFEYEASAEAPFELVDVLVSSAQNVVHMICESISLRMSPSSEKKRQSMNPDLTDAVLFKYLEQYLRRLEGPLAVQVWGRFLQLAKEIAGNTRDFKPQTFPTLRCATVLAEKITQTTAMEDRRIRKELQDIFAKLLDSCVGYVGRSYGSGSWIRRSANDTLSSSGRDSPAPGARDAKIEEKLNASTTSLPTDTPRLGTTNEVVTQLNEFIASVAIPNMRRILMDNDKVSNACANIVYYIVTPSLKGRTKPMEVDPIVVKIVYEMSKMPFTFKAWKSPVTEMLNDNRVFNGVPEAAEAWKPIIKTTFDSDKTAFPELLSKISTAPSANIFTNREYEMLVRSLNLRRLSFVLLAGDKNHYLTVLPSVQEKLVDVLRNVTTPIVQSEVYLCIRVLLCRVSPHNLTSFWPVLLTELYRIFEQIMLNVPSDGSEDLPLVLAACKCLDLLIAVQTEEFQIHQWIFVTDTVDAIYRPNDWFPEAMMDQLAEIAGSLPRPTSSSGNDSLTLNGTSTPTPGLSTFPSTSSQFPQSSRPMRKPMLTSVRQIDSIRDLIPFFSSVSISTYESVYASNGSVDWEIIERGIMDDLFDGRLV